MFKSLAADITGSADNCECISIEKFNSEDSKKYLVKDETAFIYLKAKVEEHIFTDKAYIQIKGDSAVGKKRLVRRFDYTHHQLHNVMFETAGFGITDGDCEIKFNIGNEFVSLDVFKKETPTAVVYYTALCAVAREMARRRSVVETSKSLIASLSLRSDSDSTLNAVLATANKLVETVESSYGDIFKFSLAR